MCQVQHTSKVLGGWLSMLKNERYASSVLDSEAVGIPVRDTIRGENLENLCGPC